MTDKGLQDTFGRQIRDLRISVTDRCNFRCLYCLPETEEASNFYRPRSEDPAPASATKKIRYHWKPRREILTYEEIVRFVRIAAGLGVQKLRLTGGEPLLRPHLPELIHALARIQGIQDLALTSNGFGFQRQAQALYEAGLDRMTFSLDSLNRERFLKMTGRDGLEEVLQSIRLARSMGFAPIKVNAVIIRGLNDHELPDLVAFGRQESVIMRFIEFMPLDAGKAWQREHVVSRQEMLSRLHQDFTLLPLGQQHAAETAQRWQHADGQGEIGIIAPVSSPFCGQCNRIRLTADGQLRTCLFSLKEHDFKLRLREGSSDHDIAQALKEAVLSKEKGHAIGQASFVQPERTMSFIGG
jgi:cyclic pyranopterin phosphate synthase